MTIIAKVGASYVDHTNDDAPEVDSFFRGCYQRGVRHERNLVHRRQKSKLKSRNPSWNPEIHCEIQKSNLKSRNPLWNPEIQSEIQKSTLKSGNPIQDSIKIVRKYPYTFINYTILQGVHVHRFYDVIECHQMNDLCTRPIFGRVQRSFFWGDVIAIVRCIMYDEHAIGMNMYKIKERASMV